MFIVERVLWAIATILFLSVGLYFTFKLRFSQFNLKEMLLGFKKDKSKEGITPFQSLMLTLGARIGVGSLAGMALALYYGGPGVIFWMWLSTLICAPNAFSESVLGVFYRKKEKNNYIGGPSYYISQGLNNPLLGKIYAILLIFTYILGFLTVQSNTIVKSITEVYNINPLIISISIMLLTLIIIYKGLNTIALISSKLVPFMTITYISICTYILIINIDLLPNIINIIIKESFNPTTIGIGFLIPLIIGMQRGIFSNEAGIGTGAIAAATSNTNNPNKQGFIQVFGIYIETLIISSLTVIVILLSDYKDIFWHNINGIELTQYAFSYHLGNIGNYIVMISIILFAFSTIITGYYYGESNLKYLFKNISNNKIFIFKIIVVFILLLGGVISPIIIWSIADIFIVILGIINVIVLFLLRKKIINIFKYYLKK